MKNAPEENSQELPRVEVGSAMSFSLVAPQHGRGKEEKLPKKCGRRRSLRSSWVYWMWLAEWLAIQFL